MAKALLNIVTTISKGFKTEDTANEQKNYARAATREAHAHHINLTERKWPITPYETIHFTKEEAPPTPVKTPLFGFSGEWVYTEGSITHPVIFGAEGEAQTTRLVSFLIVECQSANNIIIG